MRGLRNRSRQAGVTALLACLALWPLASPGQETVASVPEAAASSSPAASDAAAPAHQTPLVVPGLWLVMGSSSAMGNGAGVGRGWAWLLQAHMHESGVSLINLAKSGTTTYAGVSADLPPLVVGRPPSDREINIDTALSLAPSLLIVSYPSNDTANGYGVDETVGNILAIRKAAIKRQVPVMVLSSQPRRLSADLLAKLTRIDEQLRAALGPCFVDVYGLLAGPDGLMLKDIDSGDGIHPNNTGHARIYDQVRRLLDSQQCVRVTNP